MIALFIGVMALSLAGSLHCAGMCGAFVAIACGTFDAPGAARPKAWVLQAAYHGGRLVTYTIMGVAAGAAGKFLDLTGALVGVRPIAAALAGATLVVFGVFSLLRLYGVKLAELPAPGFLKRMLQAAHKNAMSRPPVVRAAMIGLFTTLLPCGWLYAFVITAAGTASPFWGAAMMAGFWVGTLPVLVGIGVGARSLLGKLGQKIPAITCVALILLGVFTLVDRWRLDPQAIAQRVMDQKKAATQPVSPAVPPCCAPHAR